MLIIRQFLSTIMRTWTAQPHKMRTMTMELIQMVIFFHDDEWMRRGEDYLRKIVQRWHRRKLRISPEFIWNYPRHHHQYYLLCQKFIVILMSPFTYTFTNDEKNSVSVLNSSCHHSLRIFLIIAITSLCVWLRGGEFRVNYWEAERGQCTRGTSGGGGEVHRVRGEHLVDAG